MIPNHFARNTRIFPQWLLLLQLQVESLGWEVPPNPGSARAFRSAALHQLYSSTQPRFRPTVRAQPQTRQSLPHQFCTALDRGQTKHGARSRHNFLGGSLIIATHVMYPTDQNNNKTVHAYQGKRKSAGQTGPELDLKPPEEDPVDRRGASLQKHAPFPIFGGGGAGGASKVFISRALL